MITYSIEELAEETGFDKRLIRSFIEQGLLRGPESKGRYARYTDAHLIRLKAIKQLREMRGLTLGEIRAALISMSEEDIRSISAKSAAIAARAPVANNSVLEYLQSAFSTDHSKVVNNLPAMSPPHGQLALGLSAVDRLALALQREVGKPASYSKGQNWHRFSITPDIELSVRGLQDGGQIEQWDQIADCLREILLGGGRSE